MHRRIVIAAIALLGLTVGLLLPRPWAEAAPAQATGALFIRCIGFAGQTAVVHAHNPGTVTNAVHIEYLAANGSLILAEDVTLTPQASESHQLVVGAYVVRFAARSGVVLAGAEAVGLGGGRSVPCFIE